VAISGTQETRLTAGRQKFTALFAVFPANTITFSNDNGGALASKPMIVICPRYSRVAPSGTVVLDASKSYEREDVAYSGSYTWSIVSGGGSLSATNVAAPTFTAPASEDTTKISCTISNGNGDTTGYCYVRTTNAGQDVAEVVECKGSASGLAGWQMKVKCPKPADVSAFTAGKVILLHAEDTWDGTADTFSSYGRPYNVMVGVIRQGSVHETADRQHVEFTIEHPGKLLQTTLAQIEETLWSTTAATGVHSVAGFCITDAIFHLMREHTNWTQFFNLYKLHDDGGTLANLKVAAGPLWDLVVDIAGRTFLQVWCDRHGQMLCVPDIDIRRIDGYWSGTVATLTEDHWLDIDAISFRPDKVAQVNIVGIKTDLTDIRGGYPSGHAVDPVPGKTIKGIISDDASRLDTWAQNVYIRDNHDHAITLVLPLNHSFDLFDEVGITYSSSQAGAGIDWTAEVFYITSITYNINLETRQWQTTMKLNEGTPPAS